MKNVLDVGNIDIATLPWFPIEQYHALPRCPALYFVLDEANQVTYIGRTISLNRRWVTHHRLDEYATRPGMKLAWLFVGDHALFPVLEAAAIQFFEPCDNRRSGPHVSERKDEAIAVRDHPSLQDLLTPLGILSSGELGKRVGLTTQQAWNLWHGYHGVGSKFALLLHERLGLPLEELLKVKASPKYQRRSSNR